MRQEFVEQAISLREAYRAQVPAEKQALLTGLTDQQQMEARQLVTEAVARAAGVQDAWLDGYLHGHLQLLASIHKQAHAPEASELTHTAYHILQTMLVACSGAHFNALGDFLPAPEVPS